MGHVFSGCRNGRCHGLFAQGTSLPGGCARSAGPYRSKFNGSERTGFSALNIHKQACEVFPSDNVGDPEHCTARRKFIAFRMDKSAVHPVFRWIMKDVGFTPKLRNKSDSQLRLWRIVLEQLLHTFVQILDVLRRFVGKNVTFGAAPNQFLAFGVK